jgi:hypothetical protein
MPNNVCPTTPYSKKQNPYSDRSNPYTPIHSPFSDISSPYEAKQGKYVDKYFCPIPNLLQSNGGFLLQSNGFKLILN